jgi:hypothetical protein
MRHSIRALAVLLVFLASLTLFSGEPRAGNNLAARVAQLEALVAEQQADLNKQPVVIDANGVEVGIYVDGLTSAGVHFDLEGISRFGLRVHPDKLSGQASRLFFESDDCSGTGFMEPVGTGILPRAFHIEDGSGRTFLSTGEVVTINERSQLDKLAVCQAAGSDGTPVLETVRIPEIEDFTPPFQVVTRGDLLAEE